MADERVWWLGWEVPDEIDRNLIAETWPAGMVGWLTGWGGDEEDGYETWVGMVVADSAESAWIRVLSCFDESVRDMVTDSDITSERRRDSSPISDRFPGANEWLDRVWSRASE